MKRWITILLGTTFVLIVFQSWVFAYFDPGMGSMLLQVIFGTTIGFFILAREKIIAIIKRIFSKCSNSK